MSASMRMCELSWVSCAVAVRLQTSRWACVWRLFLHIRRLAAAPAQVFGYARVADYYGAAHSAQYLPRIRTPTLLLSATDDLFVWCEHPRNPPSGTRFPVSRMMQMRWSRQFE